MTARRRGELNCAQALSGPGHATADDCNDGEEVSKVDGRKEGEVKLKVADGSRKLEMMFGE